jgi:hypothetical protein
MNQDGVDDLGLWTPDRSGQPPAEAADWYFLISNNGASLFTRVVPDDDRGLPTIEFTPQPFAADIFAQFGDEFALPVVGNFDPPVGPLSSGTVVLTNPINALDVDDDQAVTLRDVVQIINVLADPQQLQRVLREGGMYPDVSQDRNVTLQDAVIVINHIVAGPPRPALSQTVPAPPQPGPTDAANTSAGNSDVLLVTGAATGSANLDAALTSPGFQPHNETYARNAARRFADSLDSLADAVDAFAEDVWRQWA